MEGSDTYLIRPNYQNKFKPTIVKECIREIVREKLSGVRYNAEEVANLSHSLAECIKDKVKNAGFDRYKLVVQVVIGEQRGQGVKTACSVLWRFLEPITTEDKRMDDRCSNPNERFGFKVCCSELTVDARSAFGDQHRRHPVRQK
ncbi:Tctex1 domain-containing protein 2 [Channa argus]|uniref:Tctex1 domain-containing protein 2 n=1 Tax=Channa argus TaxID=215402 RepID=A0A6G1PKR2_CHAAH|nr:Tctex1 domain-containing protein 2 [Channa argus]